MAPEKFYFIKRNILFLKSHFQFFVFIVIMLGSSNVIHRHLWQETLQKAFETL